MLLLLLLLPAVFQGLEGPFALADFVWVDESVGNWERDALEPMPEGLQPG